MKITKKLYLSSFARTSFGFIQILVAFFMMPFILARLGDDWYGIWVLVGSIGGFYYLMDLGLSSAVSRYVAHHLANDENQETNAVINTSLVIYSVIAVVVLALAGGVALGAGLFIEDLGKLRTVQVILVITGLRLTLEFPFNAFVGIVQAKVRYDLLTSSHLVTLLFSTAAIYAFLSRGYGIVALAWITFIASLLSNLLFYLIARHLYREMKVSLTFFRRAKVRELFGYSIWSFLIQIADQLRHRIDSVVIAALLSPVHVTHYFIGARLVEYFSELVYRATNMITPIFTTYQARRDHEQMRVKLLLLNRINVVLGVFGGGMVIVLGEDFIRLWMGEEYADAYPILVVLMSAMIVNLITNPATNVLFAVARHRYLAGVNILEGLANLGLSLILIPKFGILGCALGTAIPLLVNRLIIIPPYVCRQIGLGLGRFYGDLLPTAFFTVVYVLLAARAFAAFEAPPTYLSLALAFLASCPMFLLGILFVAFNREERKLLFSFLPEKRRAGSVGIE
ncbi:MAG: oligosaccharide flippase family protein [Desulfuromonadales bacterium]